MLASNFRAFAKLFIFLPLAYFIYALVGNDFTLSGMKEVYRVFMEYPHFTYYLLYPLVFPFLTVAMPLFFDGYHKPSKWLMYLHAGISSFFSLFLTLLTFTAYQFNQISLIASEKLIEIKKTLLPPIFFLAYYNETGISKVSFYSKYFNQLIEPLAKWPVLFIVMLFSFFYQFFVHRMLNREPNTFIRMANNVSISFLVLFLIYFGVIFRYVYF